MPTSHKLFDIDLSQTLGSSPGALAPISSGGGGGGGGGDGDGGSGGGGSLKVIQQETLDAVSPQPVAQEETAESKIPAKLAPLKKLPPMPKAQS